MTWAEDRAPVGTDPSADPGAESEGWAAPSAARLSPLRFQHECDKSRGLGQSPRNRQPIPTPTLEPTHFNPLTQPAPNSGSRWTKTSQVVAPPARRLINETRPHSLSTYSLSIVSRSVEQHAGLDAGYHK